MNISRLSEDTKEYFYSLPLDIQKKFAHSHLHITCPEDIERYYKSAIEKRHNPYHLYP